MKRNTLSKNSNNYGLNNRSYLNMILLCCLLVIVSCKAKKQLVIVKPVAKDTSLTKIPDTRAAKLAAIKISQSTFNTFSGKARTKLDINGNTNDVTLNIRIKSGQKIWVSITAIAGLEVARALITPDSILLINRLQTLYVKQPFSYVYKFAGSQVNYKTVESLLVGNIMPELINENANVQSADGITNLSGTLQALVYKLMLNPAMKASQSNISNQAEQQSLQVNNGMFTQSGNKLVPSQIDITSMAKDQKIQVNLHYIKIDFDQPLEYPFSIPARYSPAN